MLDEVAVGIVLEDELEAVALDELEAVALDEIDEVWIGPEELEDTASSGPKHSSAAAELLEEAAAKLDDSLEEDAAEGSEALKLGDNPIAPIFAAADFKALELLDSLRGDAAAALELLVKGASIAAAIATAAASDPMGEAELRFSSFSACLARDLYNSVSGTKIAKSRGIEG